MRRIRRKPSVALLLAGAIVFAGLGVVTHQLDHDGQSADVVCAFCVSASHGKAPPPAIVLHVSPSLPAVQCAAASTTPIFSDVAPIPPARAPPPEAIA